MASEKVAFSRDLVIRGSCLGSLRMVLMLLVEILMLLAEISHFESHGRMIWCSESGSGGSVAAQHSSYAAQSSQSGRVSQLG
jgi:hypothetical protein